MKLQVPFTFNAKTAVIALLVLIIIVSFFKKNIPAKDPLGRGGPDRVERIASGSKEINEFKQSFDGKDPRAFRRKLNRKVRNFELNNDVHVVRSSVTSEGPIIVQ